MSDTGFEFGRLMAPVAIQILGEPNKSLSTKTELRWGTRGSFSVDPVKGTWCDHEDGDRGGGVLRFLKAKQNLEKPEAILWLREQGHLPPAEDARPKIVATYDYRGEKNGSLLFQVVRYEPKNFRQRRPDGNGGWIWNMAGVQRVPYKLPKLIAAIAEGLPIFIPEGEKGVHAVEGLGLTGTCSPGGAGKWRAEYSQWFRGADVILLQDNDEAGRKHVEQVAGFLRGIAGRIRVLALPGLPEKGDVFDWVRGGGTASVFAELVANAPAFQTTAPPPEDNANRPQDRSVPRQQPKTANGAAQTQPAEDAPKEPDPEPPPEDSAGDRTSQGEQEQATGTNGHVETEPPPDYDVEIARLAKLDVATYERVRQAAAKRLNVRTSVLDKEVAKARGHPSDTQQGRALHLPMPEPWPEPVDGAVMLSDLAAFFTRYAFLPALASLALALWAVHTYLFEVFRHSARLHIRAIARNSGKTTVLDLLEMVVCRALPTAHATSAVLFRAIEMAKPTLVIDEADTFVNGNEEVRGVLNAGHKRGGQVLRAVGDDFEPRAFCVFAPVAIAGIGNLPPALSPTVPSSSR